MNTLKIVTLRATANLLDKSDAELNLAYRFHARFPESATDLRVAVIMTILSARACRRNREIRKAEMLEAQTFEMLFFTNDEIHGVAVQECYQEAALCASDRELS